MIIGRFGAEGNNGPMSQDSRYGNYEEMNIVREKKKYGEKLISMIMFMPAGRVKYQEEEAFILKMDPR